MPNTKWIMITLITVWIGLLGLSGCSGLSSKETPTPQPQTDDTFNPVVSATGKVVPALWSNLSVSTAGVVGEVLVDEGDRVTADQILLRLEGSEARQAAITQASYELAAAENDLNDLNKNAAVARQETLIAIAQGYETMRTADRQLYYFTVPINQRDMDMFTAADKMAEILAKARAAWDPYKYEEEFLPTGKRSELKKDLDNAEGDMRTAMLRIQYAADLGLAQAKLEKAKKDYERLKGGPDPDQLKIAQERLQNAKAALAAAQAAARDLELRAPFAGEISRLGVRSHEWVTPGQTVILISDPSSLRIETTDLGEIDVARVKPGDAVTLTYDALPDVQTSGKVLRISPKESESSGVNYTVVIDLAESPAGLRWGMTAFADIRIE
jgi:HlyD family secretion protein